MRKRKPESKAAIDAAMSDLTTAVRAMYDDLARGADSNAAGNYLCVVRLNASYLRSRAEERAVAIRREARLERIPRRPRRGRPARA